MKLIDVIKGVGYNPNRGAGGRFTSGQGGASSAAENKAKPTSKKERARMDAAERAADRRGGTNPSRKDFMAAMKPLTRGRDLPPSQKGKKVTSDRDPNRVRQDDGDPRGRISEGRPTRYQDDPALMKDAKKLAEKLENTAYKNKKDEAAALEVYEALLSTSSRLSRARDGQLDMESPVQELRTDLFVLNARARRMMRELGRK